MPDRYPIVTDEYGAYRCPLPMVEWETIETPGAPDRFVPSHRPCGSELYLHWSFSVPMPPGQVLIPASDAHSLAVSHGWELVCIEGHTLATSQAEESAEPFSVPAYFEEERPNVSDVFRLAWEAKTRYAGHASQYPCACRHDHPAESCTEGNELWINASRLANQANGVLGDIERASRAQSS